MPYEAQMPQANAQGHGTKREFVCIINAHMPQEARVIPRCPRRGAMSKCPRRGPVPDCLAKFTRPLFTSSI